VNFIEYWEIGQDKGQHFSWVTDLRVTKRNVFHLMRGGRARWKIENETFNTLKPTLSRCSERKNRLSSAACFNGINKLQGRVVKWNGFTSSVSIT
jgi:hypothetical protein